MGLSGPGRGPVQPGYGREALGQLVAAAPGVWLQVGGAGRGGPHGEGAFWPPPLLHPETGQVVMVL